MNEVFPGLAPALTNAVPIDVSKTNLTPRQQEVVVLICRGLTWKEIARHMGITIKTVDSHVRDIYTRTNIHGTASLVRWAIRQGLVEA